MSTAQKAAAVFDRLFFKKIYETYFSKRRMTVLSGHIARLVPDGARVLDVGCGDGQITRAVLQCRPDISIEGIDIVMREKTAVPVTIFDGITFPYPNAAFDVVLLIDMLHHTTDQMVLLKEALRVTRKTIIIKDHLCERFLGTQMLRFMDWVGNARYQITLTYNYWSQETWMAAFSSLGLSVGQWITDVKLYPFPVNLIFGRSLQFITRLEKR